MKWLRALAPIVVALAVAWTGGSASTCAAPAAPQLLQVLEVAPRDVEVGEPIAIVGEGFPAGKPARVTFRGTLHRPGEAPVRGAEIVVTGAVLRSERVEVPFTETTQALFCDSGDRAAHTTFDGTVEVAFAAASAGAPPIVGQLDRVTLDVRPASLLDVGRDPEGERVLGELGVRASPMPSRGLGLVVDAVAPGSRADAAGIGAGDVLVSFDGVRVASLGDAVPVPGEREAAVGVRRAGSEDETVRTVSVDGLRRAAPTELLGAALVVLGALAIALGFGAPAGARFARALQRALANVRARAASAVRATGQATGRARTSASSVLGAVARDALPPAGAPAIVDAAACALLAVLPFGQYLVAAQLDVGILFVTAATALACAALVGNGSAWRGARAAAHVLVQHLPAIIVAAGVVMTTGALRVREIEHTQGGWPWDWLAFRSPAGLVGFLLFLTCARIEPDAGEVGDGLAALVDDASADARTARPRGPWLEAACRAHRIVVAGLATALFLGGWLLPGRSPAEQDARPAMQLLAAAWLLAKTAAVVFGLAAVRWGLPRRRLAERTRRTLRLFAPLAVAGVAATAAWTWWSPTQAVQLLVSGALVVSAGVVLVALAQRVRHAMGSVTGDEHLNPFL